MKKQISLILIVCLIAFACVGCGKKKDPITKDWTWQRTELKGLITDERTDKDAVEVYFDSDGEKFHLRIGKNMTEGTVTKLDEGQYQATFKNAQGQYVSNYILIQDKEMRCIAGSNGELVLIFTCE